MKKKILLTGIVMIVLCTLGFLAGFLVAKNTPQEGTKEAEVHLEAEEDLNIEEAVQTEIEADSKEETEEIAVNCQTTWEEFASGLPVCALDGATYAFTMEENGNGYVTAGLKGVSGCFHSMAVDLDWDGMEEILTFWLKENVESGNDIFVQIYECGENGFVLADEVALLEGVLGNFCDSGAIRFLLKDKTYICVDSHLNSYLAADGMAIDMRMYRYTGRKLEEYISESLLGSDFYETGIYHEETNRKLEALGMFKTAENIRLRDNFSFFAGDEGLEALAKIDVKNSYIFSDEPMEQEAPTATCHWILAGDEDFILPQSASEYITEQELDALNDKQLRLARNEIYARYGWHFEDKELQTYFEGKPWYISGGPYSVEEEQLSEVEIANRELIRKMEGK